jgi:hypothetical protein
VNILKISTLLYSALFAALLVGCESEDDVIPEITPQKKAEEVKAPQKAENDAEKKSDAMPELQPIQSLSSETAGAESAASTGASVEPGSEGSVTIQVSIQPSKRSANAILKKLEEKGIKGYLAQVENITASASATSKNLKTPRPLAKTVLNRWALPGGLTTSRTTPSAPRKLPIRKMPTIPTRRPPTANPQAKRQAFQAIPRFPQPKKLLPLPKSQRSKAPHRKPLPKPLRS